MENSPAPRKNRSLTCPACESGQLIFLSHASARCTACGRTASGSLLETLVGIVSLPDAQGSHACDCGHPEMRCLPDGIYRCPACAAEVVPHSVSQAREETEPKSGAYWSGWLDGRYTTHGSFTNNRSLARWKTFSDRLDYYRGHREGEAARRAYLTRFRKAS